MKFKATGCGSISTVFSGIVLLCVSSIIIMMIITIVIIIRRIVIIKIMIMIITIIIIKSIFHFQLRLLYPLLLRFDWINELILRSCARTSFICGKQSLTSGTFFR